MAASGTQLRPRSLTVADAEALAALSQKLGGSETVPQWVAFFGRPNAIAVGTIADGQVVGYAAGEVRTGFGLPKPVAWVEAFGIDLDHRGAGLGRTILGELLRRAAALGAAHVYTLVPVHDRVLAPFFRQLGFRDEPLSCLGCSL
ncbi:MAG: GNAT family N-acetyltransferase [Chloroflexi bacterium]|nr:GNAT family N-acetyltransferase [Chloroflexota bacterium]